MVLDGIPEALKHGIAAGIGLFVVVLGLVNGGVVVRHPISPIVPVKLGDLANPAVQTALFGILLTAGLLSRGLQGAVLLGIFGTALFGLARGVVTFHGIVAPPPSLAPTFGQLDVGSLIEPAVWPVILIFLYMAMFDAIGTLIGVGEQAGLLKEGKLPRATRALSADASASVIGACLGTTTVTAYVESAAGVQAGGRTGFANIVTAALFLLTLLFAPLVETLGRGYESSQGIHLFPVTAPALVAVGCFMARALTRIPWEDTAQALPAFLTVVAIPLTYSIADGLAFGFVVYPLTMLFAGRAREVRFLAWVLAGLFVARYVFLRT
jgi:AGZA family xanthine/uracil permease-like MFS transporter